AEWTEMQGRVRLESGGRARTLVDRPLDEIVQNIPELTKLEPTPAPEDLPRLLRKVGEGVKEFFRDFPNTSAQEQVTQERLEGEGKVRDSVRQQFQYLMLQQPDQTGLGLEEHRSNMRGSPNQQEGWSGRFMVTSGFASQSLHFHVLHLSESRFRY